MKVLITGGTGFIGSTLALRCLERGYSVKVLAQQNTAAETENRALIESRGAEVTLGSLTNWEHVFESLQGIDVVFHLAAVQHEANVPDQRFWDVNVTGTKNVLEASLNAGVKRFLHGSTIGVYGSTRDEPIGEDSPLTPDNIYGITKLEGERLALAFSETLPVVIIRISEAYGPGDRRLLKLFNAIKHNGFLTIGSGRNTHHPIYIDDLTDGLLLAATAEQALGRIFVLAGPEPITTNEMVQVIARELGRRIPKLHAPLSIFVILAIMLETVLRPLGIQPPLHRRRIDFFRKSFAFSKQEAIKHLGFAPKCRFAHGVRETLRWYTEMGYI